MKKSMEELQKEHDEAHVKREQYQHQIQRLENHIRDQQDSERKKRNHRLITRGQAVTFLCGDRAHRTHAPKWPIGFLASLLGAYSNYAERVNAK